MTPPGDFPTLKDASVVSRAVGTSEIFSFSFTFPFSVSEKMGVEEFNETQMKEEVSQP